MIRSVFGESVQGASHKRSGKECQDSFKAVEKDKDTVILAVADGHGSDSCPYSKAGSDTAVDVFCMIMSDYLDTYAGKPETLLTFLKREGDTKVAQEIDTEWKRRILEINSGKAQDNLVEALTDKDNEAVYKLYGTTLIGLVIVKEFIFAFQLGDGDIIKVSKGSVENVIEADKLLGIETHSLSKIESWKKAVTIVKKNADSHKLPIMYMLTTDGMANSYKNDDEFKKTCADYYALLKKHGVKAVAGSLGQWLGETSELGCGDDITALFAYYSKGFI